LENEFDEKRNGINKSQRNLPELKNIKRYFLFGILSIKAGAKI